MSDLSNTCFMCFNTSDELVNYKSEENNTVHYLQYVIPELFIMDFKVPQQICQNCQETLHSFYTFKKMCLENSCRLRNNIKNLQEVGESQSNLTEKSFIEMKFDNANSEDADLLLSPNKLQLVDVNDRFSEDECEVDNLEKCSSPDVTNDNKNNTHDTGKISKSFECSICNKRFSSKQYLIFHLKLHSGSVDIHCKVCNKCFPCRSQLRDHMALHTGTKDFECLVCYKKFGYPSNLREHMKIHTDIKKYKCSVCSKMFLRNCDLTIHSKMHSNTQDFECTICEKKFALKSRLNTHLKIHTNVKDIKCAICFKEFAYKKSLEYHMLVHTGEKNFQCNVCNKKFARKDNMKMHIMRIHQNK